MPRRNQSAEIQANPHDIIDLTQDSPLNAALRRSRNRVDHDDEIAPIDTENVETVSIEDDDLNEKTTCKKHKKKLVIMIIFRTY